LDELEALRPAWDLLWRSARSATVFQRPEWLLACARTLAQGPLRALALWRAGRLVGLLPLQERAAAPRPTLVFLGSGVSDYLDALLDPEHARAAAACALRWLGEQQPAMECVLDHLPPSSTLLRALAPRGLRGECAPIDVCPMLALPGDRASFEAGLGRKLRTDLHRALHKAERAGELRAEQASAAQIPEYLDALVALHGGCWRARGNRGVLDDRAVQALHGRAAPALAAQDALILHGLRLDGRLVAVVYGFRDRGCHRLYLSGFDPAFARLSLGTLAVHQAIAEAIAEGAREVDFMRGREDYKYGWGARDRPLFRRTLRPAHAAPVRVADPRRIGAPR
jgi:CelD/BcsL family acetyltransferase involved in cellulose biosynthesis